MRAPTRIAALLVLLGGASSGPSGCGTPVVDPVVGPATVLAGFGDSCGAQLACEPPWLCVDGACVVRPWPPEAEPPVPTELPNPDLEVDGVADVGSGLGPEDGEAHGPSDVIDVAELPLPDGGTLDADIADVPVAPPDTMPDAEPILDVQPADVDTADVSEPVLATDVSATDVGADADVTIDVAQQADVPEEPPPANTVVYLVAADAWDEGVSMPTLIPEEGQGWVTQLEVPSAGTLIGFQAMMGAPFGSPTCGLVRAALWFPYDAGEFIDYPSWVSTAPVAMTDSEEPMVWFVADTPEVPAGPVRLGLIVDQPCLNGYPRPALVSDTSGDVSGSWLYAANATGVALVPGEALGLTGRWVLRALVEVEL